MIRRWHLAAAALCAACGGSSGGDVDGAPRDDGAVADDATDAPPPEPGFHIAAAPFDVPENQLVTRCFFFRTPNTEELGARAFRIRWSGPVQSASLYLTRDEDFGTPGTHSTNDCGFSNVLNAAIWHFTAFESGSQLTFPADDGTGTPIGRAIAPDSGAYLRVLYNNFGQPATVAQIDLDVVAYEPGAAFTRADTYNTADVAIQIGPMEVEALEGGTCVVPAGARFFFLQMEAHKQLTRVRLYDAGAILYEGFDELNPGATVSDADPFLTFASGEMTYECEYTSMVSRVILQGPEFQVDERCDAHTYYFPSVGPKLCLNDVELDN